MVLSMVCLYDRKHISIVVSNIPDIVYISQWFVTKMHIFDTELCISRNQQLCTVILTFRIFSQRISHWPQYLVAPTVYVCRVDKAYFTNFRGVNEANNGVEQQ